MIVALIQTFSFCLIQAFVNPSPLVDELMHVDFSPALRPQSEFLGFIGKDKQRIYVQFDTIYKDPTNVLLYHIKGSSTVKGNRCDFKGSLTIKEIEHRPNSDESDTLMGLVSGKYRLVENPEQKHVGIFEGRFWTLWLSPDGKSINYNKLALQSDDYRNNQYEGIWRAYGSEEIKMCNWGEYRVPNAGDLDIGAAEFSADPKYEDQGW